MADGRLHLPEPVDHPPLHLPTAGKGDENLGRLLHEVKPSEEARFWFSNGLRPGNLDGVGEFRVTDHEVEPVDCEIDIGPKSQGGRFSPHQMTRRLQS